MSLPQHLRRRAATVLCAALFLAASSASVSAAELVGRIVDVTEARVFAGAQVRAMGRGTDRQAAPSDAFGFFRLPELVPGSYLLDVSLPDGRSFATRLVLLPGRKTQFVELDYSRIVPPEEEENY